MVSQFCGDSACCCGHDEELASLVVFAVACAGSM